MTGKQKQLLDFIRSEYTRTGGVSPSYDEMKNHLGLTSKSGIHRLVHALKAQGEIVHLTGKARAIMPSECAKSRPTQKFARIAEVAKSGMSVRGNRLRALKLILQICAESDD